eukprot:GHVU01082478.1.p1 GENE.GHVU01082478.1~~GHVU01082478.1.p1  ORF type:complete len:343 (+),score=-0.11 GHVU01082478.1:302-1330(+)
MTGPWLPSHPLVASISLSLSLSISPSLSLSLAPHDLLVCRAYLRDASSPERISKLQRAADTLLSQTPPRTRGSVMFSPSVLGMSPPGFDRNDSLVEPDGDSDESLLCDEEKEDIEAYDCEAFSISSITSLGAMMMMVFGVLRTAPSGAALGQKPQIWARFARRLVSRWQRRRSGRPCRRRLRLRYQVGPCLFHPLPRGVSSTAAGGRMFRRNSRNSPRGSKFSRVPSAHIQSVGAQPHVPRPLTHSQTRSLSQHGSTPGHSTKTNVGSAHHAPYLADLRAFARPLLVCLPACWLGQLLREPLLIPFDCCCLIRFNLLFVLQRCKECCFPRRVRCRARQCAIG